MTADWRERRIAKNETSFRDINERLEQGLRQVRHTPDLLEFVCECGDRECETLISLSLEEYEAVRSDSRRFAIAPGHVFPEVERVVDERDRYLVIEKFGDSIELTDAADQRGLGTSGRRSDQTRP